MAEMERNGRIQEHVHQEKSLTLFDHVEHKHEGRMPVMNSEMPKGYYYSPLFLGTYFATGLGLAAGVGTFAMAAPILGTIDADIGPDASIIWVAITYILMLTIGSTLIGRVTDIFGRRWFFVGGSCLAVVGSIVCATAQSIPVLIGGMTLLGTSTAAQASFAFVMGELVPIKYRFVANAGLYLMGFPLNVFGPKVAIELSLSPSHGWRWCFYILIIVNTVSTACWFFFYHPPTFTMLNEGVSKKQLILKFDFIGFVLLTGGLTILVLGLSWGGSVYPWKSAHVIATLVIGILTLIAFVVFELLATPEEPYVPMHLFRNAQYVAVLVTVTVVAMTYYAFSLIWPTMLATLYPSSAGALGWKTCAAAGMLTIGDTVGLAVASFIPRLRILLIACMAIGTIFLAAVATGNQHNQVRTIVFLSIGTFSTGIVEAIVLTMSSVAIKDQNDIGAAVGFAASFRSLGGTLSSTIYTTILANRLKTTIPALVPAAVIGAGLPATSVVQFLEALQGLVPASAVPGLTPKILAAGTAAYQTASAQAYSTVFLATIAFGVIGLIGTFFCPELDPATEHLVAKELHHTKDEKRLEAIALQAHTDDDAPQVTHR